MNPGGTGDRRAAPRALPPAHIPVLYNEILSGLQPRPGGRYLDGTVGLGGHAAGLLQACAPDGQLLGLDCDPAALTLAGERLRPFGDRVHLARASYLEMGTEAARLGWGAVDGILLDLGLSSLQLEDPARGFSFQQEGPLDMRFDPSGPITAADLVNRLPERELADLLFRYGEERASRRIARAIVQARPLTTTGQLAALAAEAAGGRRQSWRIHPATRTFQALRIAVNEELQALAAALPLAISLLQPGGRLAVITFHSLEDRIVKQTFRLWARGPASDPDQPPQACRESEPGAGPAIIARLVNRKPIVPGAEEIARNPRARSAKLRIAERLAQSRSAD